MLSNPIIVQKFISELSCRWFSVGVIGALALAAAPGPLIEADFVFPKTRAGKADVALHWPPRPDSRRLLQVCHWTELCEEEKVDNIDAIDVAIGRSSPFWLSLCLFQYPFN
jgi:hypothetical protein